MMGLLSKIFGSKKDVSNVDIDNKAKSCMSVYGSDAESELRCPSRQVRCKDY